MVKNYQEMLSSEHSGFIRHNGIRVVSVDEEKSVLTADVTPENSNIWGGVHGGFLYAMADTAAGAFARINYGQHNVTLNGSINYLRSTVQSKALTGRRPTGQGRRSHRLFRGQYHRRHRRADRPRRDQHVFSEKVRNALKGSASGKARCAPFFILSLRPLSFPDFHP